MLVQIFGNRTQLLIDLASMSAAVFFDRSQFTLIVLNIATNAHHAMPTGGTFRVEVGSVGTETVSITFSDTGHGMSADVRERIFEAFFTTKPAGQGTGLGLAVASDLLAAAGGSIEVCSEPGAGTTLRINLRGRNERSHPADGSSSVPDWHPRNLPGGTLQKKCPFARHLLLDARRTIIFLPSGISCAPHVEM